MDAAQLMAGGMKLILMSSPFMLIYVSIAYSNEIIDLIRHAVLGRSGKGWD
jgi:hypothetical protein